jgi:hypothetical protein
MTLSACAPTAASASLATGSKSQQMWRRPSCKRQRMPGGVQRQVRGVRCTSVGGGGCLLILAGFHATPSSSPPPFLLLLPPSYTPMRIPVHTPHTHDARSNSSAPPSLFRIPSSSSSSSLQQQNAHSLVGTQPLPLHRPTVNTTHHAQTHTNTPTNRTQAAAAMRI